MMNASTDRIHKEVTLRAPLERVWRAITDAGEFGQWFGVKLEGQFKVGEQIAGQITTEGYEHLRFRATVERMEPRASFQLRWCPYAYDPGEDYSGEPTTLVEFRLEKAGAGTKLTVTESGFDSIPVEHRTESFRRNEGGWTEQMKNISRHIDG